ncbi:MFS transporter [Methanocella paludicola SANAE]|uniref:MFS transporter n=1 Tax=Methanocella paludicola (strain DSM 17711 / JCM 13418 / NBRC 101707 / SANAE) TaxID=304371 RepID=D1Z179_METPS|nr:tetracycline resistance MFS efflux pump [Methanocella paludicola]BAI62451.1 MFS transporter [Methanocella paludicola SANAE]
MKGKTRQIAILVFGMFFLTLGFSIIMPILPYYTQKMGASALELGLLMASYSVMQLIVTPFWGEMSDRIGRKPIFLIGLFGYGISFIIYGFATQLWMLFAARMLGGALAGGMYPASLAYIADVTEHSERGKVMGLLGAASGLGMIFGPSISGILSVWGLTVPFFVTAVAAFIFGIIGYFALEESRAVDVHHPVRWEKVSLLAPLRSSTGILFVMMLLVAFLMSGFQTIFAYYMGGRFSLYDAPSQMPLLNGSITLTGPTAMAVLFTVMGVVGVLCQGVLVGVLIARIGEARTVLAGMAVSAAGFLLINVSWELLTIMLSSSLIAIGVGLATPCLNSLASKATDEEHQGAVLGVLGSYGAMGRIVGPPLSGFGFDINVDLPYFTSALLSAAGALVLYVAIKRKGIRRKV